MDEEPKVKSIVWIGSSRRDLKAFPAEVKDVMGYALYQAQDIVDDYQSDTYRAVYTVKFSEFVYALHAFQKKSKKGIATPKTDIDFVKKRLRAAEEDYKIRQSPRGRDK